jgi:hypothetical protein
VGSLVHLDRLLPLRVVRSALPRSTLRRGVRPRRGHRDRVSLVLLAKDVLRRVRDEVGPRDKVVHRRLGRGRSSSKMERLGSETRAVGTALLSMSRRVKGRRSRRRCGSRSRRRVGHLGVLDRGCRVGARVASVSWPVDVKLSEGLLERTDPLVPSLNLEGTLLPVGLELDVGLEVEAGLGREVGDADIEGGQEVAALPLDEGEHLLSERLDLFERRIERNVEAGWDGGSFQSVENYWRQDGGFDLRERLGRGAGPPNVLDELCVENVVADDYHSRYDMRSV